MADSTADTPAKQPQENQGLLVSYLQSNRGTLIFLGAALVLTSFIIRDALREHLKDLSDGIDKAENQLAVRKNTGYVLAELADLRLVVDSIKSKVDHKPFRDEEAYGRIDVNNLNAFREFVEEHWDLVARLRDTPDKAFLAKEKNEIGKHIAELWTFYEVKGRMAVMIDLGNRTTNFADKAMGFANKERERAEWWYRKCTVFSYMLFGLILLFGAIGKLAGIDLMTGE